MGEPTEAQLIEQAVLQMTQFEAQADQNLMIEEEEELNGKGEPVPVTTKADTYFPINLNFAGNAPVQTVGTLTEEEKRKRLIWIMAAVFAAILILIIVLAVRNSKK